MLSGGSSGPISEPAPGAPLDPESERLLARIPGEVTGDSDPEFIAPGAPSPEQDAIASLMAQVTFEEQDVRDCLSEFFAWLAQKFDNENWKLTERQERMLGKPAAQLANSLWVRLQTLLPDVIARWCMETPGAFAFLTVAGLVITPKIMNQIKVSRERKQKGPKVRSMQPQPQAVHRHYDGPVGTMQPQVVQPVGPAGVS